MSKDKFVFICQECGYNSLKWQGKCPECGSWNSFQEEPVSISLTSAAHNSPVIIDSLASIDYSNEIRLISGISEIDRVLGGGIVRGSSIFICGEPGIGKSTLLLQLSDLISNQTDVIYVSGEESINQIKLRANRLGINNKNIYISSSTDVEQVCQLIKDKLPHLVIIDSIQTMTISGLSSNAGSITQVKESTMMLNAICKSLEIPIIIVGHVNKDGNIAGPKVLEHMVDTVLYFEGDRDNCYRIIRSVKNRFGSTNEIGVFEMTENGLKQVLNPSELFLSSRPLNVSGTSVTCILEGSRSILTEVQALVTKTNFGNPKRIATGFDYNRLFLILAVLEKRAGFFLGNLDVYVNAIGGMRTDEPATDLSIALSIISNLLDRVIPNNVLILGELGLTGEIRSVHHLDIRVKEAVRMGFDTIILSSSSKKSNIEKQYPNVIFKYASNITEAIKYL